MYDNLSALSDIISIANKVNNARARALLRSAFISLSNEVVQTTFGPLSAPTTVTYGSITAPATQGGVTISDKEFYHIYMGRKLDAIKEYKDRTQKGLIECKRDIEKWGAAAGYFPQAYT